MNDGYDHREPQKITIYDIPGVIQWVSLVIAIGIAAQTSFLTGIAFMIIVNIPIIFIFAYIKKKRSESPE